MNDKNSGSGWIGIIVIAIIVFALLGSCGGSSSSSSKTCKSCHRTFTSSSEKSSIARTNMCTNCFDNYKWVMDAQGKDLLGNPK